SAAATVETGSRMRAGAEISTGDNGYVTLDLPDGSRLRVQSQSRIALDRLHAFPAATGMFDSSIGLKSGRIDSHTAPQRGPGSRFEIRTPSAAAGVRGTDFRISVDETSGATRSEVLAG